MSVLSAQLPDPHGQPYFLEMTAKEDQGKEEQQEEEGEEEEEDEDEDEDEDEQHPN